MTKDQFLQAIKTMPVGQARGAVGGACFASILRTRSGYDVRCGWIVDEAYDDDYQSCTDQPFGSPKPWVGRSQQFDDPEQALSAYDGYYADVRERRVPAEGQVVGSVTR